MRQGKFLSKSFLPGVVTETNDGDYTFEYDNDYIQKFPYQLITFSMPVSRNYIEKNRLFPFFEGLIPKVGCLEIASESWKINKTTGMGLLLACCKNCIGAVN